MSKNDVVKPGHFKLAGRMRPGKDTIPEEYKQDYSKEIAREEEFAANELPRPGTQAKRKIAAKSSAPGPNRPRKGQ